MKIKVKRLTETAKLPVRAHNTDSGADIFSDGIVHVIEPGQRRLIGTGIAATVEPGYDIQFVDKSGLAWKNGITVLGGLIDEAYRGELKVLLLNIGDKPYTVESYSKLTQMVVRPVLYPEIIEVDELDETVRGEGGFGSTGVS
jgi:dUTP pyrophosphatase